jgi:hypothetical protein
MQRRRSAERAPMDTVKRWDSPLELRFAFLEEKMEQSVRPALAITESF